MLFRHTHHTLRPVSDSPHTYRLWPIISGLLVAALVFWILPVTDNPEAGLHALSHQARWVAAIGSLMAFWWMTEALPIEVTGLVPVVAFPLTGAVTFDQAASPYADKIIFLFLGGMFLGQAMEVWGLHKRFALSTISIFGSRPSRLIGAFLLATALISMVVSNTAATIMMLPIGASVASWVKAQLADDHSEGAHRCRTLLGPAIVLAIAFGASIGGVGTVIGTPPVAQFAAFSSANGKEVTFTSWLFMGVPTLIVVLPLAWFILTKVAMRIPLDDVPGVQAKLREQLKGLGTMVPGEWGVLIIFSLAALCWISSRWLKVDDAVIAIFAAIFLFIIPIVRRHEVHSHADPSIPPHVPRGTTRRPILVWREAERVPWGILILFGGGLSLANAIKVTGVDQFIASYADGLEGVPLLPLLWIIALVTIILTEFTSNTALVAAALPIASAVAQRLDIPPAAILVTVTLTASLGFMLPAGTAPNALAFASGHVTMRQMMKAGLWLDVSCAFIVPLLVLSAMKLNILPGM